MTDRLTVTTQDLRRLLAAADPALVGPDDTGIPTSVLEAVQAVVPCSTLCYMVGDFVAGQWLFSNDVGEGPIHSDGFCAEVEAHFRYWDGGAAMLPATYSYLTSEHTVAHRVTDFFTTEREYFASPFGQWTKVWGDRFGLVVPVSQERSVFREVSLWRDDGRDFSDRELLLLQLLRPHLVELEQAALRRRQPLPLTWRQTQIVHLVADGMTNRQVARHTGLSEGTVRTHLQHVFERLGVQSRAAAVALVLKDGLPEAEHLDAARPQIQDDEQAPRRLTLTSSA